MASVFRKTALERLSSPDQLDSMLKITSPMSWLGIGAAAVLAAVVTAWSFMGTIPDMVSAPGFLVYSYNTNTLYSPALGTVKNLLVYPGEVVEEGTPVMELYSSTGDVITVESDQSGIVSAQLVSRKDEITPNAELFRLSPITENELSVVCYVDLDTARQLEEGMETAVYLNAADSGTYGHMEAVITNVDRCASSAGALTELLGSDGQLAYQVTQNGPVAAVTCELKTDGNTESGYYFSTQNGAEVQLMGGEQATVQIVINESAPISKVFPMFGGN